MLKKIFKSKKEVATNSKVEKLNSNELKNVIGGGSAGATAAPTPTPVAASGDVPQKVFKPGNF